MRSAPVHIGHASQVMPVHVLPACVLLQLPAHSPEIAQIRCTLAWSVQKLGQHAHSPKIAQIKCVLAWSTQKLGQHALVWLAQIRCTLAWSAQKLGQHALVG